jgi:membrane fusion protein (multidrug efflux system)
MPTAIDPNQPGQQMEQTTYADAVAEDQVLAAAEQKAAQRKTLLRIGGAVVAVLAIFFGIRYSIWASSHEETDDAYLTGHLHPVSPRVTGTVQQVLVDDNQHVKEGQTLVVLDPSDFQVHLDAVQAALLVAENQSTAAQASIASNRETATARTTQATGSISEAKAAIATARATVESAQAGIPRAQADLAQAEAIRHQAELDLRRYQDLAEKKQISRQQLDHAQAAFDIAVAGHASAEQQVRQAEAQFAQAQESVVRAQATLLNAQGVLQSAGAIGLDTRVRENQFQAAQSSVEQAKAALADAKLQLSYTVIKAPVTGRVGRKSVEVGQRVQIGQPLLAVVEEKPWIVANFKETQLEKMRQGQEVDVEVDTFSHHKFHGRVDSLAPGSGNQFALLPPDNATGNFTKIVQRIPVKIVLDDMSLRGFENLLAPGMSAIVTVTTR